jgi:repressor LexA
MIEAGIFDGDWVVIEQRSHARNGEIVVALVDDEATTKRFFKEGDRVRLQPENELYEPIVLAANDVTVVGKVVGVLRRL